MAGLSALASNPAWLKAAVAQKALTASTPEDVAAMTALAQKLKQLDSLAGGGLSPEEAMALRRALERPTAQPQSIQSQIQTQLPFADGGAVPKKSIWNRVPTEQHLNSSGQMDPGWEQYLATNERINPNQGLEAPLLDPLDPMMLPKTFPQAVLRKIGKLGAEAIARGIESGHPALAMAQPMSVVKPKGGQWFPESVENALHSLTPRADVGDLQNTGLMKHPETGKYIPISNNPQGYASGGSVKKPFTVDDLHGIIASLEAQINA